MHRHHILSAIHKTSSCDCAKNSLNFIQLELAHLDPVAQISHARTLTSKGTGSAPATIANIANAWVMCQSILHTGTQAVIEITRKVPALGQHNEFAHAAVTQCYKANAYWHYEDVKSITFGRVGLLAAVSKAAPHSLTE